MVAQYRKATVRCAQCGHLGSHLNGPQCFFCGALLPPPGSADDARMAADGLVPVTASGRSAPAARFAVPHSSAIDPAAPSHPGAPAYVSPPNPAHPYSGYDASSAPVDAQASRSGWRTPTLLILAVVFILGRVAAAHFQAAPTSGDVARAALSLAFELIALGALCAFLVLLVVGFFARRKRSQQSVSPPVNYQALRISPPHPVRRATNPYAGSALLFGIGSIVVTVVAAALGYYVIGYLGIIAVYAGIRGVIASSRVPSHPGLVTSLTGLMLSALALVTTLLVATGLLVIS